MSDLNTGADIREHQANAVRVFNRMLQLLDESEAGPAEGGASSNDDEVTTPGAVNEATTPATTTPPTIAPTANMLLSANPATVTQDGMPSQGEASASAPALVAPIANMIQSANPATVTQNGMPNQNGASVIAPRLVAPIANMDQSANSTTMTQNGMPSQTGALAIAPMPAAPVTVPAAAGQVHNYAAALGNDLRIRGTHISNYGFGEALVSKEGIKAGDVIRIPMERYEHRGTRHHLRGTWAAMTYVRAFQNRDYELRVQFPALPGSAGRTILMVRGSGPKDFTRQMNNVGYFVEDKSKFQNYHIYRNNTDRGTVDELKWTAKMGLLRD